MSSNLAFSLDLFPEDPRTAAINALHVATALYTQDPVVVQLLTMINWPLSNGPVIDTSCGDGAFLGRALERLLDVFPGISDEDICERLHGWEIHHVAAGDARRRLHQILVNGGRSHQAAQAMVDKMVQTGDFLTNGPQQGNYRAIIGNPPYLRMQHVPDPLRTEYEDLLPEHAKADLLHSFLDRCVTLLAENGELAMVTSDRWLFNDGAARLREVIGARFGISHVERLESSSTFYRPKQRRAGTPPRVHPVGIVLKPHGDGVRRIGHAPFYPDASGCDIPYSKTLGDIADVRLAPWLGTKGVFLVNESVAAGWPAEATVPAIDTDDVRGGILGTPTRRAILTRPNVEPAPEIVDHLDAHLSNMCRRGKPRSAKRMWLPPETFHRLDLSEPSLLVPRITTSLRPVRVPAGILAVNHNLTVVRRGKDTSLEEIESLLCSKEANDWIAQRAARLENGFLSITTKLLRTLPVFGS